MCVEVQLARQFIVLLVEIVADEPLEPVDMRLWSDEQGGSILLLRLAQCPCLCGYASEVSKNIAGLSSLLN